MSRILIVDDEPVNLKLAEFILKTKYEEVDTATSGRECLKKLEDRPYDLVLMDLKMPDMTGIETLEVMRCSPKMRRTRVIFLTASGSVNDVVAANRLDACGYIKKPMSPEILLQKVAAVLGE